MRLVVLVPPDGDREGTAAAAWARGLGYEVRVESSGGLPASPLARDELPWWHSGDCVPDLSPSWRAALAAWLAGGGRLLLSLLATPLAHALGAPGVPPIVQLPAVWRDADDPLWSDGFRDWPSYPHIRGAQGWGAHPLFDALQRGTFTWEATEGEAVARTYFRAPAWPSGRVLAVDRAYVRLDAATAVAWEFDVGAGAILCLGANVAFTARATALHAQRDRYVANALAYLDPRRDRRRCVRRAWPHPADASPAASGAPGASASGASASGVSAGGVSVSGLSAGGVSTGDGTTRAWIGAPCTLAPAGPLPQASLQLDGAAVPDTPFTIASPHALVVGDEAMGVREAWLHPLCILSDGVQLTVDGAPLRATTVRVTPGLVERHLVDVHGAAWREIVAASPDHAAIAFEVAPDGIGAHAPLQLAASLRLRLQWPIPSEALQPLASGVVATGAGVAGHADVEGDGRVDVQEDGRTGEGVVAVRGADGATLARVAVDGAAHLALEPSPTAPRMVATSVRGRGLRLAVTATTGGDAALERAWRWIASPPAHEAPQRSVAAAPSPLARIARALERRDAARHDATTRVVTPHPDFDQAWEWAKARLASCIVDAPGVGRGFVAGYAASRPGWGDARPGYAWFFGRDACWCGDALLAAGMFDEARVALEFLADTADVTGKVAHEVTTSGVAHYDAADATPLWLRFVTQYADWTGDLGTVRTRWDAVRAAFAFVLSHDRDGDGLPENTGVGHGWIESGPLGGGAVTSYTAAIWTDAVRRLAPLARMMGDESLARRAAVAAARAAHAFETRLRDPHTGRVVLQLDSDGRRVCDITALAAVPILLGVDTSPDADAIVATLASGAFSASWGVRMIARGDARYRPRGYHCGAVWPLYTGWASLAAFARGRADEGWQHLAAVASCAFARERGAFDEVLDGDTGAAAGICPDQAWSAAMVISPLVHGMMGIRPSAPAARCAVAPSLPPGWASARLAGLRVGRSRLSLAVERLADSPDTYRCEARLDDGPAIALQLGASVPVTLEAGAPVVATVADTRGRNHGKR